jgi:cytoskeletal protein RodZ
MGSLGETLRQARLDRGASVADAERETHIRRKYLEALESEDYAALPALVYVRGFIRSYARYLGLDPEATLDLYAPSRVREERPVLRSATPQLSGGRPISARVFIGIAGLLLAGLLLAYLWTQYNYFVESLSQADQRTPTRVGAGAAGGAVAVSSPTRNEATLGPAPDRVGFAAANPDRPDSASSVPTVAATPTLAAAPVLLPTPERGVVLEARVTERTWMEVWVDGTSQMQATLQAGASRSFTANRSVRIRVGNAGAVQVTVNGEPKGPLGEKNQVKDFVWER